MDRLTEREPSWVNEEYWISARNPNEKEMRDMYIKLREYENTGLIPAKVAELAQAKGYIFQCEINQNLFVMSANSSTGIEKTKCSGININSKGEIKYIAKRIYCDWGGKEFIPWQFSEPNFGKTVFLTKAEAQAALDRMEGQE